MTGNFYAEDVGAVLSTAITDGDEVYVVNPPQSSIPDVVYRLRDASDPATVKLLADKDALKAATADFVVAGHAADLVTDGTLAVRRTTDVTNGSVLVSADRVVSLVHVPDHVGGLAATDGSFVDDAYDHYVGAWEDAERHRLRAPPLSDVRETLATEIGQGAADDFDTMLAELPAVRNDGQGLDEVTVCLLVAARHGVLLYDISRWGEDVGLASKATFSRTKGELEDSGVIRTEKVPIDVGRPRLRLRLATDRLRSADIPELTTLVRERLESHENE